MLALALCSSLFFTAAPAHPKSNKVKIVVFDFESNGVDKSAAASLTELAAGALRKLDVLDVLSQSDIQKMLGFESTKQLVGCTSSQCVAELGDALGVARIVTGSVSRLGDNYILALTFLDAKSAQVIERESRTVKSLAAAGSEVEVAVRFVVRSVLEGRQGELAIHTDADGAEVQIDGRLVGITPLPRVKLASGPHTVRVNKDGFISFARDVTIEPNLELPLAVALTPSPETIARYDRFASAVRYGAYGAAGLGAAAVITGLVLYYGVAQPQNNKHNAGYDTVVNGARTAQSDAAYNSEGHRIQSTFVAGEVLGVTGAILAAAGVGAFFLGPKPGVYDGYKVVELGKAQASVDVRVAPNLAFVITTIRY